MLYLLKDNEHYKVGYTENETTLKSRLSTYKIHNPTYICLGVRHGTKEDEKKYHKLFNCSPKSEWSCSVDTDILNSVLLDFSREGYIASLFGENIELFEGNIPEVYSEVTVLIQDINKKPEVVLIILCYDGVYIKKATQNTIYKVESTHLKVKTFYQDYDSEFGEKYVGFVINDTVFYDFQIRMNNRNLVGNYATKNSILYEKLLPIMKEFSFEEK